MPLKKRWTAPAAVTALAVLLPLLRLFVSPHDTLLGYSGIARGEFENWAWLDWWIPRYAACQVHQHAGHPMAQVWALLRLPRDLDIGNYLDGLFIAQPMKAMFGNVWGHNARVALVVLLNALATWFMCRQVLLLARPHDDPTWPAAVGAIALACNPITLWDIAESRFAQGLIAGWVAYIGCMLRWLRDPSTRNAMWGGLSLALAGLIYWYAAMFLSPLVLLWGMARPRAWRAWGLHVGIALVSMLPFALPFLPGDPHNIQLGTPFPALDLNAVPAVNQLGPPGPGLIIAQSVNFADPLCAPGGTAISCIWLAFATVGFLAWRRRIAAGLAACVTLWWIFALGPYLHVRTTIMSVPLPYQIVYRFVPFVCRLNWPARTLPFVMAGLVMLSLPAFAALLSYAPRMRTAWILAFASVGVISPVLQGVLPLPATPLMVPMPYRTGALGDTREQIYEVSFELNSSQVGYYQSWHGHPVLGNRAYCPGDPKLTGHWKVVQRQYGGQLLPNAALRIHEIREGLRRPPDIDTPEMAAWHLR